MTTTAKTRQPYTIIGVRFPAATLDQLDARAEVLTKERGDRVGRSTVIREILAQFFIQQAAKGA